MPTLTIPRTSENGIDALESAARFPEIRNGQPAATPGPEFG